MQDTSECQLMRQLLNSEVISMSKVRSFLAIDLDDSLKPNMDKIINKFKQIDANIKYVDLVNLHLTLKFFGDIDSDQIDLIEDKINSVIKDFKPFNIKLKGCGAFPNKNRIRVIWVGIDEASILKELHDSLDREFGEIGFDLDKKFSSHLTIGRMKSAKGKDDVKNTIAEFENFDIGVMEVNSIKLKKSTLTPNGPIYEDLIKFEL